MELVARTRPRASASQSYDRARRRSTCSCCDTTTRLYSRSCIASEGSSRPGRAPPHPLPPSARAAIDRATLPPRYFPRGVAVPLFGRAIVSYGAVLYILFVVMTCCCRGGGPPAPAASYVTRPSCNVDFILLSTIRQVGYDESKVTLCISTHFELENEALLFSIVGDAPANLLVLGMLMVGAKHIRLCAKTVTGSLIVYRSFNASLYFYLRLK